MDLLHYLKNLRTCTEKINPCILDTMYKTTKMGVKDNRNWPDWKQISSFCASQNQMSSFVYVPWRERYISYGHTWFCHSVFSNRFSGCYLAYYKTTLGYYACHIHTGNNDKKHAWNEFAKNYVDESSCIIFRPDNVLEFKYDVENSNFAKSKDAESLQYDYWGIISPHTKECLSVCVCTTDEYIGSGYNPTYRADVYKIKSKMSTPLRGKLILQSNGTPY